ncbi:MAG: metallophosphoesterase [Deltaproteobacteria bacterium]|nr:metallophosphoesterase [Deltaproteobacteria bacterium]
MRPTDCSRDRQARGHRVAAAAALVVAAGPLVAWLAVGCAGDDCEGAGCVPGAPTSDGGTDSATGGAPPDDAGTDGATDAGVDGAPPPVFSFVVAGDTQFATTSCTSGTAERRAVPNAIAELDPTFVLHTGDLMDHGYEDGAYAHFSSCWESVVTAIPFFPTSGNHDMGGGAIWDYKTYLEEQLSTTNAAVWGAGYDTAFTIAYEDDPTDYSTDFNNPSHQDVLPSGVSFKTFFAVRYENVLVLSFESGTRWWTNTPTSWIESHLQAAQADDTIDHAVVIMHHPMYSTTMDEDSSADCVGPVREPYEQLFRDYDATLVFSGHAHVYDRFYVPDDGSPTQGQPPPTYPHDGAGVHYIVTGGAGGPLPNGCNPMPAAKQELSLDYSQARDCGYHVTRVEVEGDALTVSIIGVEGDGDAHTTEVWDQFQIL